MFFGGRPLLFREAITRLRVGSSLLLLSAYVARAGTQVLILWAFAQRAGPAGAGEFALAFAVTTPVFVLFELSLRNVYQTLHDPPPFRQFFSIRLGCIVVAAGLTACLPFVSSALPSWQVMFPLILMKFADSLLDICFARLQVLGRIQRVALLIWVNTVISLAAIVATMVAELPAETALFGSAMASVCVLVAVLPRAIREAGASKWLPSTTNLRRVLAAGTLLGLAQTLIAFLAFLPALYLTLGATKSEVGIFATCQYSVTFANLFFNSALQTWLTPLRRTLILNGRAGLARHAGRLGAYILSAGILGGIATLTLLPWLVPLVFGSEFKVTSAMAVPFAITMLALSAEYALNSVLLVLNRYGSRLTTAVAGVFAALALAVVTFDDANVELAGYVVLVGVSTRAVMSAVALLRERAAIDPESPTPAAS